MVKRRLRVYAGADTTHDQGSNVEGGEGIDDDETGHPQAVDPAGGDRSVQVIGSGHALVQNLRRGHYELAIGAVAV